jgi:hypothetical protein
MAQESRVAIGHAQGAVVGRLFSMTARHPDLHRGPCLGLHRTIAYTPVRLGRLGALLQNRAQIVPAEHLVAVWESDAIRLASGGGDAGDFRNGLILDSGSLHTSYIT